MELDVSIGPALERCAALFPDDPAIISGPTTLTWREFAEQAEGLAGFFAGRGIGVGDRVAIGLRNGPEYLVAVLAALKLRAIPVNVNFRYRAQELGFVLSDSGAVVLVHDDALVTEWAAIRDTVPACTTVVQVGGAGGAGVVPFDEALAAGPRDRPAPDDDPWLLYTGGTTGLPKAVVRPQSSVLVTLRAQAFRTLGAALPETADELEQTLRDVHPERLVLLAASPLMHGTGIYGALTALLSGGTAVLLPGHSFDPAMMAGEVARNGVTDLHIVGDAFALPLAEELEAAAGRGRPHDLSRLRRIQSVGAVWSAQTKQRLLALLDVTLVDLIAATEGGPFAGAVADRNSPADQLNAFRLLPGARVLRPDDTDVSPGSEEVGVLAAPAPVGMHYAGAPEKTAATFRTVDGVLYTMPGDLVTVAEDGALRFLGRGSGVINTGGEKVYAGEVEEVLRAHPDVMDAIVIGAPDPRWGNVVAAVVQARPGAELSREVLGAHVAETLATYKQPRRLFVVPELARTASGKSDLNWARQLVADDRPD